MQTHNSEQRYQSIIDAAFKAGAKDAILIASSEVVIEERVQLKCQTGCPSYGRSLTCPPYAPKITDFKRIIQEYHHALLIRFPSKIIAEPEIIHSLLKNRSDPGISSVIKEKTVQFNNEINEESRKIHAIMLEIERIAFQEGNPFALAFTVDSCNLCKTCNVKEGICIHSSQMRFSVEAVGINIIETARRTGMQVEFPCPIPPDRITLLLIA